MYVLLFTTLYMHTYITPPHTRTYVYMHMDRLISQNGSHYKELIY